MLGGSTLKHWSSTQRVIALSSGESELYAATRALSESIGMQSTAGAFHEKQNIVLSIDAMATIGLAYRQGLGRARHIQVSELWIQAELESGNFKLKKIPGSLNPADILTKAVNGDTLAKHLKRMGFKTI